MKQLTPHVAALAAALVLVAAPATADIGWMSDANGGLHHVDDTSWSVTPVGTSSPALTTLAVNRVGDLLGVGGELGHQDLFTVDRATGLTTQQGQIDGSTYFTGLTEGTGGTLYVAGTDFTEQGVYRVALGSSPLAVTPVGEPTAGAGYVALAGSCDGELLGVDQSDDLVRIDRRTGAPSTIGHIATAAGETVQALAFDHASRALWALVSGEAGERILSVDPTTGASTPTSYLVDQVPGASGLAFDSPAQCRYRRSVSAAYHASTGRLTGRIGGEWTACRSRQKVRVFKQVDGPDRLVGRATTGRDGRYSLRVRLGKGVAYAVAPESSSVLTGVCLEATSHLTR